jgi:phospholipase C
MFALSATTAGSVATFSWYKNKVGTLFPQKTIFDQVTEANLTWRNYYNDTPWEMFMEGVAHNTHNLRSMEEFWSDARAGTLPRYH